MAVTIKNIAEYAGVSTATVSLALQDKPCVAGKTRKRIQRLAADLGYMPSGIGRALQSGRSHVIGYLLPFVSGSYFNEILQGVGIEAAAHGYGLMAAITGGSERETLEQLRIFREKRVDGLLVSSASPSIAQQLIDFEKIGCPLVFCSTDSPLPNVPMSITDNRLGGRLAAEHLIERGAKRLAYFGHHSGRYEGFSELAARRGLGPAQFLPDQKSLSKALEKERLDAIFAYSDEAAVKAKQAIDEAGLSMPGDIMLMGFDNAPFTAYPAYDLTSVEPQKRRIGEEAVRILLRRIEGAACEPALLAPSVVPRGSTARRKT